MRYDFLYVPSTKKRQEGKMIKVQEQNYRDAHRDLSALKGRFNLITAALTMAITYAINNHYYGK